MYILYLNRMRLRQLANAVEVGRQICDIREDAVYGGVDGIHRDSNQLELMARYLIRADIVIFKVYKTALFRRRCKRVKTSLI
jgi:hypothetical protein